MIPDVDPAPPANPDGLVNREDILARAEDRRNLCRIMSWAHIYISVRWSNTNLYIGIPSTIFAAIASVQAISDLGSGDVSLKVLQIIFSVIVAGLAPLLTFLNPSEKAGIHKMTSRVYEQLADRYDAFILRCQLEPRSIQEELNELVAINQEYVEAKKPLPVTPEWAYQKARSAADQQGLVAPMATKHHSD
ncbi:MAG: SLATT domain-containing protein [Oscillatoriales cyanobacterium RM2_1_1]|nr:SLATT domain-containing protein [Oscillatoriales cyanobacterium SM2_3_0]NJO46364.1 SLATT domain-containing protein [Oscillatoriales cyanobacterium RM2_1_1]